MYTSKKARLREFLAKDSFYTEEGLDIAADAMVVLVPHIFDPDGAAVITRAIMALVASPCGQRLLAELQAEPPECPACGQRLLAELQAEPPECPACGLPESHCEGFSCEE